MLHTSQKLTHSVNILAKISLVCILPNRFVRAFLVSSRCFDGASIGLRGAFEVIKV